MVYEFMSESFVLIKFILCVVSANNMENSWIDVSYWVRFHSRNASLQKGKRAE